MGKITLEQAAQWCGGKIDSKYKDITFFGANNDSRKLEKGQLFVALQGVRDGHDFIPAALEKGAAAILCTVVLPELVWALCSRRHGQFAKMGLLTSHRAIM